MIGRANEIIYYGKLLGEEAKKVLFGELIVIIHYGFVLGQCI